MTKPKLWVLFDRDGCFVKSYRSVKEASQADRLYASLKPCYFLTAGQVEQLHYSEFVTIENIFERNSKATEKASR